MALAQYVAGMAFSNVGLGCIHSMAHPLGARAMSRMESPMLYPSRSLWNLNY